MEAAAEALQAILQNVNIDATAASDAIKHLLNLQAVGLASIQHVDPVRMYIENQASQTFWRSIDIVFGISLDDVSETASKQSSLPLPFQASQWMPRWQVFMVGSYELNGVIRRSHQVWLLSITSTPSQFQIQACNLTMSLHGL